MKWRSVDEKPKPRPRFLRGCDERIFQWYGLVLAKHGICVLLALGSGSLSISSKYCLVL